MSNKISQMSHSRQLIDYYSILNRKSHRYEQETSDTLFQLTYHLNSHYLLMSSTLDVCARLLNSLYDLGYEGFQSYTLDKIDFLERLKIKRKGLYDIVSLKKYLGWMFWLKPRRNYFAHEGHPYLTPLLQKKSVQLTEQEMNEQVQASMDWNFLESTGADPSWTESLKEFSRFQIDLEQNYETVVKDMMTFDKQDRITGEINPVILFPLRAIIDDNEIFSELIKRVMDNLQTARFHR